MKQYIIAVLVVLIIYLLYLKYTQLYAFLPGVYSGDEAFLNEASLEEFYLFIHKDDKGYHCTLIVGNANGDIIENEQFDATFGGFRTLNMQLDKETIIPTNTQIKLDIIRGKLTIFDDKKTYAVLIKDNMKSNELV